MARSKATFGGRLLRVFGALLGTVLLAVVALAVVARSPWGRARVAREAERALARAGVSATCDDAWLELPSRVELRNVRVASTEGGPPLLEAKRVAIRLRTAALFAGRFEMSVVDVDAPTARVALKDGAIVGLPRPQRPAAPGAPWPVGAVNVHGGRLELARGRVRAQADGVEATARAQGSGGEISVRAAGGHVERGPSGAAICGIDATLDVRPGAIVVTHLDARGAARPACSAPDVVAITADGVQLTGDAGGRGPGTQGHVHAHGAADLLEGLARMPHVEGTFELDGDVQIVPDSKLPELRGRLDAFGLAIGRIRVARSLHARIETARDEVRVPQATLDTIEGEMRVSDVVIRPFAPGVPAHGRVDAEHLRFEDLLVAIGAARHPHVAWTFDEVRWHDIAGTLAPFVITGDLRLQTGRFSVYDAACDLGRCTRVWSLRRATLRARATFASDRFEVAGVRATVPGGQVLVNRAIVGFHDVLRIDGARARLTLARVSPLASLALGGQLRVDVAAHSRLSDPVVNIEGAVDRFDLHHHPLGDVLSFRARYHRSVVSFEDVHVRSRASEYEAASVRILLLARGHVDVAMTVSAGALGVGDLLWSLRLEERPGWASLGGVLRDARARLRYVLGGPQDARGEGTLFVSARARLDGPTLGGQRFDGGAIDLDARWWDRRRGVGLAGVDIDLRSLSLSDVGSSRGGRDAGSVVVRGWLASGVLDASAKAIGLPLAHVTSLARIGGATRGHLSGVAHAAGTLDTVHVGADLDATEARFRGVPFGPSSLHADAAFGRRTPPRAFVRGDLMGGQVHVDGLALDGSTWRGQLVLRDLDVTALVRAARNRPGGAVASPSAPPAFVSGDLRISSIDLRDPAHGRATFVPTGVRATLGGVRVRLRPNGSRIVLADDAVTVPTLAFDVGAPGRPAGIATARASIASLSRAPRLDAALAVQRSPLDLAVGLVPGLRRIDGHFGLVLTANGPLASPRFAGWLRARAAAATVGWIPGQLHDVDIDVALGPGALTITRARARLGGGTIDVTGFVPVRSLVPGTADLGIHAKRVRLPIKGSLFATFDAAAHAIVDTPRLLSGQPHAVVLTGVVDLRGISPQLLRGVPLGLTSIAPLWVTRPKPYREPAPNSAKRDVVDLDVAVRLRRSGLLGLIRTVLGPFWPLSRELWLRGTNRRPQLFAVGRGGRGHAPGVRFEVGSASRSPSTQ